MDVPQLSDLNLVFSNLLGSVVGFAAIVLFILLVSGGVKYVTAGSDPKAAEAAKRTITSSITGLLVIAFAYLILVLIKQFTGADVTEFNIFSGASSGSASPPGPGTRH